MLTVTTTTVDSGKVAAPTLDGLWADADGDGMGDYSDALKSNAVSHAVLYDLDDSSDYLVGRAGSDISGATLADWGASENNADAAMRRGFKFPRSTRSRTRPASTRSRPPASSSSTPRPTRAR